MASEFLFFKLSRGTIIAIVIVVSALVLMYFVNPYEVTQEILPDIIGDPVTIVYSNIPCMINCLTSLEGEELTLLSKSAFLDIDDSPLLINWFPCNNKIMTLGLMINEMVKWDLGDGINLVRNRINSDELNFYEQSKNLLYECINTPNTNMKCYDYTMSFKYFCRQDDYLSNYNFLPCSSPNTFVNFLSRSQFSFTNREGLDIDNDFVCDKSVGDAYQSGYSLCTPDLEATYDEDNCWPAWQVLSGQQQMVDESRSYSYGRCEDFALLYYSLFRAIDVPPSDLALELGTCNLPCPCENLLDISTLSTASCYVPASLKVMTKDSPESDYAWSTINGCDETTKNKPDDYGAQFVLTRDIGDSVYTLFISQDFETTPAYRTLILDDDYTNDVRSITIDDETYESNNILDSLPVVYSGINTNIVGSLEVDNNSPARYGFKIKIDSLTNCDNNKVVVGLGFVGERPTYYTMLEGEERGLLHSGVSAKPYYVFNNTNPDCVVDYTISNAGVILDNACSYYTGAGSCSDYVTSGYCFEKESPEIHYPITLDDFVNGFGC
ncbi:MAG: hypothetical protein WC307_03980 [Candidatus Nanoarchaeia archaeon]